MDWIRILRAAASAALAGAIAIVPSAAAPVDAETPTETASTGEATTATQLGFHPPRPPRLPSDFRGKGKWIVRDLGITVPFTWQAKNGNVQMIAGGPQYPIWFTNLIYQDTLYTLTYKWPNLRHHPCSRIGSFSLEMLNEEFKDSRFVGREILQQRPRRYVDHWRVGVVIPELPPGKFPRLPIALADIYVDQHDRSTFWQVLHFGLQNLYDPELDEWLVMDTFEHKSGRVVLPRRCPPPL
jgi:hypothetical protein